MSAEVVEIWLKSGLYVMLHRIILRPVEHTLLKGKPLSSQKGQAEAFFLIDDKGNWWILKKFHETCSLDRPYLNQIASVLPTHDGFACGTQRQVLSQGMLQRAHGYHHTKDLDHWLDGTILMPKVAGFDWASLADELRDGSRKLDEQQRVTLCANLTQLVGQLEAARCVHRDISTGNVFVDPTDWQVYLIDFDSLYHPTLAMPKATTCGTPGYAAPYAWNNGRMDPARTWCERADRYALALINTEFLLVGPGTELTGDGGIFDQDELRKRSGRGIDSIVKELRTRYPGAAKLLESAIHSSDFSECPSPQDWDSFCGGGPGVVFKAPSLSDMPEVPADLFRQHRPAAPLWPAPKLPEMPPLWIPESPKIVIPRRRVSLPTLAQRGLSLRPL